MTGKERLQKYLRRRPHPHTPFYLRPHLSRRAFLHLAGAGVTASFLPRLRASGEVVRWADVETRNTARQVIFILLAGAPSHIDTFDFKHVAGVTPDEFAPETIDGVVWPAGLMPRLAERLGDIAIVRSVYSWALQHSGMQTWVQIGRSPAAALGAIAPNIGSIVAVEKDSERTEDDVFPAFLALNARRVVGPGYLPSKFAPLKLRLEPEGLGGTEHPAEGGAARFESRYALLASLREASRGGPSMGRPADDLEGFYESARKLMYNPVVQQAFGFAEEDSERYGASEFGNACLVAKQVLEANRGARYIQIVYNGWDHHQDIYNPTAANRLPRMAQALDAGVAALIGDLKASGLWNETLLVLMGEFGRTVGGLSPQRGRDHHRQQFCVFGGAGVTGGKVIGATDPTGAYTTEPGWHRQREIRVEDIEATIYSALGINWTNVRYDDPFGRGFEYVPKSKDDVYGPIDELWA